MSGSPTRSEQVTTCDRPRRDISRRQQIQIKRTELEALRLAGHIAIEHHLTREETRVVHGVLINRLYREEGWL